MERSTSAGRACHDESRVIDGHVEENRALDGLAFTGTW